MPVQVDGGVWQKLVNLKNYLKGNEIQELLAYHEQAEHASVELRLKTMELEAINRLLAQCKDCPGEIDLRRLMEFQPARQGWTGTVLQLHRQLITLSVQKLLLQDACSKFKWDTKVKLRPRDQDNAPFFLPVAKQLCCKDGHFEKDIEKLAKFSLWIKARTDVPIPKPKTAKTVDKGSPRRESLNVTRPSRSIAPSRLSTNTRPVAVDSPDYKCHLLLIRHPNTKKIKSSEFRNGRLEEKFRFLLDNFVPQDHIALSRPRSIDKKSQTEPPSPTRVPSGPDSSKFISVVLASTQTDSVVTQASMTQTDSVVTHAYMTQTRLERRTVAVGTEMETTSSETQMEAIQLDGNTDQLNHQSRCGHDRRRSLSKQNSQRTLLSDLTEKPEAHEDLYDDAFIPSVSRRESSVLIDYHELAALRTVDTDPTDLLENSLSSVQVSSASHCLPIPLLPKRRCLSAPSFSNQSAYTGTHHVTFSTIEPDRRFPEAIHQPPRELVSRAVSARSTVSRKSRKPTIRIFHKDTQTDPVDIRSRSPQGILDPDSEDVPIQIVHLERDTCTASTERSIVSHVSVEAAASWDTLLRGLLSRCDLLMSEVKEMTKEIERNRPDDVSRMKATLNKWKQVLGFFDSDMLVQALQDMYRTDLVKFIRRQISRAKLDHPSAGLRRTL